MFLLFENLNMCPGGKKKRRKKKLCKGCRSPVLKGHDMKWKSGKRPSPVWPRPPGRSENPGSSQPLRTGLRHPCTTASNVFTSNLYLRFSRFYLLCVERRWAGLSEYINHLSPPPHHMLRANKHLTFCGHMQYIVTPTLVFFLNVRVLGGMKLLF